MRRSAQARQQRAQGIGTGREITMPLPLGGLFSEAKTSEISGVYAGEFVNWESAGTKIRLRKQAISLSPESAILQRIPYEFGADPRYIEIYADRAKCGDAEIIRPFAADCSVAYISGQAIIADGQGVPVRFDGAAFHQIDMQVQGGMDPATFDGVLAHQDRLFFWAQSGTLEFFHSATVGGLQGEFLRFPLGRLGNITGSIQQMQSLTINAGHGMNDTLAIMTSTGEIVAYEGLDPADAMDWRLLTRVRASTPVGSEAFARIGNDLWMVSGSGIVSIMESVSQGVLALVGNVSLPIATEIMDLVEQGGRWQMHASADGSQVIVNRIKDGQSRQYVFHVENRTWSVTDYPAEGFHNLNGQTEFTDINGRLRRLRRDGEGEQITARWISGWFRMPRAMAVKYLVPTIRARGPLTLKVSVLTDHDETPAALSEAEQVITLKPDRAGEPITLTDRIATDAIGEVFQLRIEVTAEWAELVNLQAGVL